MAPKTVEGGQIWLKCITGDLIMMIRDKNNIFERVENFHADLAWNYPLLFFSLLYISRSDVWAYGILMFEILTIGENPYRYSNVKNREYKEKLKAEFE